MKEAKPTVVASEPKAKELLIIMKVVMLILLILTVVEVILFKFVKICKILGWLWPSWAQTRPLSS
jgi:protein-S-isoprenylcysteine O-methyltransferase Ste14